MPEWLFYFTIDKSKKSNQGPVTFSHLISRSAIWHQINICPFLLMTNALCLLQFFYKFY